LLRDEITDKRPCGLPSTHRLQFNFQFNIGLSEDSYELPVDARAAVDSKIAETAEDVARLIDLSESTPDLFPGILDGTDAQQAASLVDVETLIARVDAVHEFYTRLESPDSSMPYPRIQADFGSWAHIRWLQVKMLFATDLYVRYRGRLREIAKSNTNVLVKVEHDVHDAQILALGVMGGALVTRERKLQRWFRRLRPDGWVTTGEAEPGV
jgi:hypothetical protein